MIVEKTKIFLNLKGILDDVNDSMYEFLFYIEALNSEVANQFKSDLVKALHRKVNQIKNHKFLEVEYMTLYERY